jgi:hypothetical protein
MQELVFEVTQAADGGFVAARSRRGVFLRQHAAKTYPTSFGSRRSARHRMKLPRNLSGLGAVDL